MCDVLALLKMWRAGEWRDDSTDHEGTWALGELLVMVDRDERGRWCAHIDPAGGSGAHLPYGYGDTQAEAVLAAIEQDAFRRGRLYARTKGGA
jgi:hypothetical protein